MGIDTCEAWCSHTHFKLMQSAGCFTAFLAQVAVSIGGGYATYGDWAKLNAQGLQMW